MRDMLVFDLDGPLTNTNKVMSQILGDMVLARGGSLSDHEVMHAAMYREVIEAVGDRDLDLGASNASIADVHFLFGNGDLRFQFLSTLLKFNAFCGLVIDKMFALFRPTSA